MGERPLQRYTSSAAEGTIHLVHIIILIISIIIIIIITIIIVIIIVIIIITFITYYYYHHRQFQMKKDGEEVLQGASLAMEKLLITIVGSRIEGK